MELRSKLNDADRHLLWDSCVFYQLLSSGSEEFLEHVKEHLIDAQTGATKIYTSSIFMAEVDHRKIKSEIGTPTEFFADVLADISIVDATPHIMITAGAIRSNTFSYTGTEKASSPPKDRVMSVGDSIYLATADYLKNECGVEELVFHSFDMGKKDKEVPILGLEDWCGNLQDIAVINRVLEIPRGPPIHPRAPAISISKNSTDNDQSET